MNTYKQEVRALLCFSALMMYLLLCVSVAAQESQTRPGSTPGRVTNVFVDTDVRQALQDISVQSGVLILMEPGVSGVISAELKDVPVGKALDIILAGTGYGVKKTPDYCLIYSADPKSPGFAQISSTQPITLNHRTADSAIKLLAPAFRSYVQSDGPGSTLVVTAPENLMGRIVDDIRVLDKAPRHVLLESRVVVLEQSDLLNLGVNWDFPQVSAGLLAGNTTIPKMPWGINIGATGPSYTNSVIMTLNLLNQNGQATIVAHPQVMAQDAKEAQIKVTNEEYFQFFGPGTVYTTSQLEKIETGTVLKIVPHIGSDKQITLEMEVEVSDVVARGQNNLPVVNRRKAKSTVRIEDGGTATVAGLMDQRVTTVRRGVPGISRVPVIGELFKNRLEQKSDKQIAIFITATLVPETSASTLEPGEFRSPTVSPADNEGFRRELEKSLRNRKERP
ncbi:MAG TPA: type II and III secretion system protein [Planctomycetota bacterium]|nr:type II and III secretion system protein [Planctomycetota bacterium]